MVIFDVGIYIPPRINGGVRFVSSDFTDLYQPNALDVQLGILSSTVCHDANSLGFYLFGDFGVVGRESCWCV